MAKQEGPSSLFESALTSANILQQQTSIPVATIALTQLVLQRQCEQQQDQLLQQFISQRRRSMLQQLSLPVAGAVEAQHIVYRPSAAPRSNLQQEALLASAPLLVPRKSHPLLDVPGVQSTTSVGPPFVLCVHSKVTKEGKATNKDSNKETDSGVRDSCYAQETSTKKLLQQIGSTKLSRLPDKITMNADVTTLPGFARYIQTCRLALTATPESNAREGTFPTRLHRLLRDVQREGQMHIISFDVNGCSFTVHHPEAFLRDISPKYFSQKRFSSFTRQLNLWGFVRRGLTSGVRNSNTVYCHPLFLRDFPELCAYMCRVGADSTASSPGRGH